MKPYHKLSRLGRLRRKHRLAQAAMRAYGLENPSLRFQRHAGNTIYRVYAPKAFPSTSDLYVKDLFGLRLYDPGWQTPQSITLELAWLRAMRGAGLPVPEPLPNLKGGLLTRVATPGIPETHSCALTRWVKGRRLPGNGRVEHYKAQGRLMARMHAFTASWSLPPGPHSKRLYDWYGLFMNDPEIGLKPGECWNFLSPEQKRAVDIVASRFRNRAGEWGEGPNVFGLIHADMGLDFNVLFYKGRPRPIDFEGSGFGYWLYDLAVAVVHCLGTPDYVPFRDALIAGYTSVRSLAPNKLCQMDLFTAAFCAYFNLWVAGVRHLNPASVTPHMEKQEANGMAFIRSYVTG